jgi:hypothetical protein
MSRVTTLLAAVALAVPLTACRTSAARERAAPASATRVDSVVPRGQALEKFRAGLTPATALEGGKASREELLEASVRALETRDTAALVRLTVTPAEFAWLYYPTTPQGLPPYDVEPDLLWFLQRSRSDRAMRRALETYGGSRREVLGYDCGASGQPEGENTVWGPCSVRWRLPGGDSAAVRVVGRILERGGRFKILSYSNTL